MTLWYITRATGVVALVLLTLATSLGLANAARLHSPRIPRFVVNTVHRSASLLAVVFVAIHVATTLIDGYVPMSILSAVVPLASSYKGPWLALGVVSLDLMLAVTVTSLLRRRIGNKVWRAVHWLAYVSWPDALVHSLGTGTDAHSTWMLGIAGACTATVLIALATRVRARLALRRPKARLRPAGPHTPGIPGLDRSPLPATTMRPLEPTPTTAAARELAGRPRRRYTEPRPHSRAGQRAPA
jgi:predicted ferric reductase